MNERFENWGLDTLGAGAVLAISVLLFPLRFSVDQPHVHAIPIVGGVASGLYFVVKRYEHRPLNIDRWRLSARQGHAISLLVLVGLSSMVFVGTYTGGRTLPFFGVAAVVGSLIFGQIFFVRREALAPGSVLAQIVAFALVVRGMALVTTPGLIGVDAWVHVPDYAASIRQSGTLSGIAESHYYGVPLYHLLVVTAAEAFDASLRIALYTTLGIVMPLSIALLFYAGRFVLPDRWALFAAAAFAVADYVVWWGIHLIPTSMGLVLFVALFYGAARIYATRETLGAYAFVLLVVVATIFTHHISTFIMLAFLGAGAAVQLYLRLVAPSMASDADSTTGAVNYVLLLVIALPLTLVIWSRTPRDGSFLEGMLSTAEAELSTSRLLDLASAASIETGAVESMTTSSLPMSIQVLDIAGFLLLLFLMLIGAFTLLQRQNIQLLPLSWINANAVMLFVALGTPMFGLYFFIPDRWFAFCYVPMVIIGAIGMRQLEETMSPRIFVSILLLIALVFPGAMLVNHQATHDNPVAEDHYRQFAFSESEIAAAQTIASIQPADSAVRADHPFYLYLRRANSATAEPLELTDDGTITGAHVVYREYQTEGLTKVEYDGRHVGVKLSSDRVCRPGMDVVYTNGDVRYCRA